MLKTLMDLFNGMQPPAADAADAEHTLQLATAVMLVEVMRADTAFEASERAAAAGDAAAGRPPKAVLVVSSYLPELLGLCDRIAVMCRGALGPCRPVHELNEHEIMLAATGAA